jgi:hypothetical protein
MRKLLSLILFLPTFAVASGIYNPGSTGAGGSGIVSPGTFTWTNNFGMQASTLAVTSDNTTNSLGVVNLGQLANVADANGVLNGNFAFWYAGTVYSNTGLGTETANKWVQVQNPTQATQTFVRVSTVTHNAPYAMQHSITFNNGTGDTQLLQQTIAPYYDYAGSSVTLSVWVNSNAATTVAIQDSAGTTSSSAHPADSAWHQLTVTRFLASNISSLTVLLGNQVHPGSGTVQYYDGVMLVPGDTPINYVPRPYAIDANAIGPLQTVTNSATSITNNTYQSTNLTSSIVLPFTTSKIKVTVFGTLVIGTSAGANGFTTLFRGATNLAVGSNAAFCITDDQSASVNNKGACAFSFIDSPASNTATTYTVKIRNDDNTTSTSWASATDTVMIFEVIP